MPNRIAVLAFVLLPLVAACKDREPVPDQRPRPRGIIVDRGAAPPTPSAAKPAAPDYDDDPPHEEPKLAEITVDEKPWDELTATAEQAAPDEPAKPPRNLKAELESMMGSPITCLKPRPANEAPPSVSISLTASVMPSGAVGRGEVSAPGLEPDEVSCVRSRLESLHFAEPIENAPITVSGSITLNRGT